MISRLYCSKCMYPQSTCLCDVVSIIQCDTLIDIMQHPSEKKTAKNTARLIPLCIPHARIWMGEDEVDFQMLKISLARESRSVIVVYPNSASLDVSVYTKQITQREKEGLKNSYRIVLLDGTWKKAYKIWCKNSWLADYKSVHLSGCESQYYIRKAPKADCLSTLEAMLNVLNVIEKSINDVPLWECFEKMQFFLRGKDR